MLIPSFSGLEREAGLDEAGRGCLAGPVYAAAVVLRPGFEHALVNDSKQLSGKQRAELKRIIMAEAFDWSVAWVDHTTIDEINILNASILAMHLAIQKLKHQPEYLIIDGNRFKPYHDIPYRCIVKGDSLYLSIAAASILAKTFRDEYMEKLHEQYPPYSWKTNKGYPTPQHRKAIAEHGITPYHRKSFHLNEQLKLDF